jgi:hypothetical protein
MIFYGTRIPKFSLITHQHLIQCRDKIRKCLNNYKIRSKLIKLIGNTLQNTKVTVNRNYTEKFEILMGVKQGDPLSATLFSRPIVTTLKQLELRGNISTCAAYADDILISARTKQ